MADTIAQGLIQSLDDALEPFRDTESFGEVKVVPLGLGAQSIADVGVALIAWGSLKKPEYTAKRLLIYMMFFGVNGRQIGQELGPSGDDDRGEFNSQYRIWRLVCV